MLHKCIFIFNIGGGLLGLVLVFLGLEDFGGTLAAAGVFFSINMAPWLLMVLLAAELAVCLPIYFGAKRQRQKD